MAIRRNLNNNPFITDVNIPNELFCDRELETNRLYTHIANGNNIVLRASRRIGKTSLLYHLFQQTQIINNYNTVLVDLYLTKNLQEFVTQFSRALLKSSFARTEKGRKAILDAIPEIKLYANLNLGPVNAGMEATYRNKYENTLDTIFSFLKKTDKRNLVVFDEFQTIEEYKDEKMSAILRTYIQEMNNTQFIFSGSEKHMLSSMFQDKNKPFYKSALQMELDIIPYHSYAEFCKKLLNKNRKDITDEAIKLVYNVFTANTFEMQQVMNITYAMTEKGSTIDSNTIKDMIDYILLDNDNNYKEVFASTKNEKEKNLLICIACLGVASDLTAEAVIQQYNLGTASSVQNSLRKFSTGKQPILDLIAKSTYRLQDKFFELWLADKIGILDKKYEAAESQFKKEREIIKAFPKLNIPAILKI